MINKLKELRNRVLTEIDDQMGGLTDEDLERIITLIDEAIARQSVKSEEVREAIELQEKYVQACQKSIDTTAKGEVCYRESSLENGEWITQNINQDIIAQEKREILLHNLAITALQAYRPKPDCESAMGRIEE